MLDRAAASLVDAVAPAGELHDARALLRRGFIVVW